VYKFKLAIRYFLRRRITALAVVAVALCVFIVVVVMTVMNGLVEEFRAKNHGYVGDCVITTDSLVGFPYYGEFIGMLDEKDFVSATSAVISGFGLLTQPGADWNIGIEITGLDPAAHSRVTDFGKTLYYHYDDAANAFVPSYATESPGCVLGIDMMSRSRDGSGNYYHNERPEMIELVVSCFPLNTKGAPAKAGTDLVSTLNFFYSDDSHSGLVKSDGGMVYIPFEYARTLCGMDINTDRVNSIHVKFKDGVATSTGCDRVRKMWEEFVGAKKDAPYAELLKNVNVESWQVNRRGIIAPMEKEQTMMTLVFLMLGVITVFVILVIFYMIIAHKSKDIGILRSIGVSSPGIVEIFICFGAMIGLVGSFIGVSGGCLLLWKINNLEGFLYDRYGWQLWNRAVYAIGDIPNRIEADVLLFIVLAAVLAAVSGALIPSIQAARRRPAEVLQVNQL
jgi:ABC-type lipoprotein release transport system permease subunit